MRGALFLPPFEAVTLATFMIQSCDLHTMLKLTQTLDLNFICLKNKHQYKNVSKQRCETKAVSMEYTQSSVLESGCKHCVVTSVQS